MRVVIHPAWPEAPMSTRKLAGTFVILALAATGCIDDGTRIQPDPSPDSEVRTGWIHHPYTGAPLKIEYVERDGYAIWDGDILVGRAGVIPETREEFLKADPDILPGSVTIESGRRWPGGIVPYEVHPNLPNPSRVPDAISHVEERTLVRFIPRTNQPDYVRFEDGSMCGSFVGRKGGEQAVVLTDQDHCDVGGTIHELLHVLGMFHEHQRCDRDTYVTIHWENLDAHEANFQRLCPWTPPTPPSNPIGPAGDLLDYELGSILHYGPYQGAKFQIPLEPVISSNQGLDHLMGQRDSMSVTDTETITIIYPAHIEGPNFIDTPGTYSWEAFAPGHASEHSYQWRVFRHGPGHIYSGMWQTLGTAKTQQIWVDEKGGDHEIEVTVTSGPVQQVATFWVDHAIGCPPGTVDC